MPHGRDDCLTSSADPFACVAGFGPERRFDITGQLFEAESGASSWAERYDRDCADIIALQDGITDSVVGAIEPEILMGDGRRAARKSPASLDAFDCSMRATWHFHKFTPDDHKPAETWLQRAIELDPHLAQAHIALARTLISRIWPRG